MAAAVSIMLAMLPSRRASRWKVAPFPSASTAPSSSMTAWVSPMSFSSSLTGELRQLKRLSRAGLYEEQSFFHAPATNGHYGCLPMN